MPANITMYCLDEITDYFDFERLCTDLMALSGHRNIEPLDGFSDKGRDAVHFYATTGRITVFAYSVREDWRAKLAEGRRQDPEARRGDPSSPVDLFRSTIGRSILDITPRRVHGDRSLTFVETDNNDI